MENNNSQERLLISVIIPLFNKKPYINRAVQSIASQIYKPKEVIIIDDGSTDGGSEIILQQDSSIGIKVFRQANKGVSAARNMGVSLAQGDFVAFLDADDEWREDHLATLATLVDKFPDAGAWCTSYVMIEPNNRIHSPKYYFFPKFPYVGLIPHYFLAAAMGKEPPVNSSCVMIKKQGFQMIGFFLENKWWAEDMEFWARIALSYPIAFSSAPTSIWHLDADNRAGHRLPPLEIEPAHVMLENRLNEDSIPTELVPEVQEYMAKKRIDYAEQLINRNQNQQARIELKQVKTKLFRKEKIFWLLVATAPPALFYYMKRLKRLILFQNDYSKDPWAQNFR